LEKENNAATHACKRRPLFSGESLSSFLVVESQGSFFKGSALKLFYHEDRSVPAFLLVTFTIVAQLPQLNETLSQKFPLLLFSSLFLYFVCI